MPPGVPGGRCCCRFSGRTDGGASAQLNAVILLKKSIRFIRAGLGLQKSRAESRVPMRPLPHTPFLPLLIKTFAQNQLCTGACSLQGLAVGASQRAYKMCSCDTGPEGGARSPLGVAASISWARFDYSRFRVTDKHTRLSNTKL